MAIIRELHRQGQGREAECCAAPSSGGRPDWYGSQITLSLPQILWPTVPSITGAKVVHVSLPGPFAGRNMISDIILQTYQQDVTDAVGALPVSYGQMKHRN